MKPGYVLLGCFVLLVNACGLVKKFPQPIPTSKGSEGLLSKVPLAHPQANGRSQEYTIRSGDQLSVKFFFNPELNEEDLVVRPDGKISLQLIHEVKASGLTPTQLTSILTEKYKALLKNPEIAVIVRSVKEQYRIFVDGAVGQPGEFEIVGSLTVLQAIALAKGMANTASPTDVVVIRRANGNQPVVIKLDLSDALRGDDLSQDIPLLPSDFVYVPESFW